MDHAAAQKELEDLAEKLDVKVTYEKMTGEGMGSGGLCKVKGQWRIIIDRKTTTVDRVAILARALARFDTEPYFLSPSVRRLVDRGKPELN